MDIGMAGQNGGDGPGHLNDANSGMRSECGCGDPTGISF